MEEQRDRDDTFHCGEVVLVSDVHYLLIARRHIHVASKSTMYRSLPGL